MWFQWSSSLTIRLLLTKKCPLKISDYKILLHVCASTTLFMDGVKRWSFTQPGRCLCTCRVGFVLFGGAAGVAVTDGVQSKNSEGVVNVGWKFEMSCCHGSRNLCKVVPMASMMQWVFILDQKFCSKKNIFTVYLWSCHIIAYQDFCLQAFKTTENLKRLQINGDAPVQHAEQKRSLGLSLRQNMFLSISLSKGLWKIFTDYKHQILVDSYFALSIRKKILLIVQEGYLEVWLGLQ